MGPGRKRALWGCQGTGLGWEGVQNPTAPPYGCKNPNNPMLWGQEPHTMGAGTPRTPYNGCRTPYNGCRTPKTPCYGCKNPKNPMLWVQNPML